MVVVAQVVAAELVAKLMNQKTVHFLGRALLEPSVAETEQVEVQPASPVTRQKLFAVWTTRTVSVTPISSLARKTA